MIYQVSVTITPLTGGWSDAHERLVAWVGIDADTYPEALKELRRLFPALEDLPAPVSGALNRRTPLPSRSVEAP